MFLHKGIFFKHTKQWQYFRGTFNNINFLDLEGYLNELHKVVKY